MTDMSAEFQTVIGADASFKGELSFEGGVQIAGGFEGRVRSGGTLHIAEGARVAADVEAGVLRVDGELKGNVVVTGKLTLSSTARMEGDLRTSRLEMADGAVFVGNVLVGQQAVADAASPQRSAAGGNGGHAPRHDSHAARSDAHVQRARSNGDGPAITVPPMTVGTR